ncbi:GGDEF domain-containing protein [Castellaniella sp. MT123]|uniref:GGDEF domain-containing protein n=1 Tax=Castellaniella sp. MT123 TaxID=3140381 RepID=UPI0031F420BA
MLNLDPRTMLVVEAFVLLLVGALTFLAAFQGRRDRTLLWAAGGMWLGCLGFLLGALREGPASPLISIVLSNMLLITGHGFLWVSLRVFRGGAVRWSWLLVGAAVWFILCQWPAFLANNDARVVVYSLLSLGYIVAAGVEAWPEWRRDPAPATPLLCVLAAHGLFYLYRAFPHAIHEIAWRSWPDFSLVMLEGLFFAISLSFCILMMVRARAEQRYRYAALHDALTALPNRRALFEQGADLLARARLDGGDVAVLMCDLDWFKQVNDHFGHEAGDRVLIWFACMLRDTVRAGDLCARLGGEEFVILAPDLGPLGAQDLAIRVRRHLSAQMRELPCSLSVSVGIACTRDVGHDLDRLLARADQALYAAKTAGRDCIRLWPSGGWEGIPEPSASVSRGRSEHLGEQPVDA